MKNLFLYTIFILISNCATGQTYISFVPSLTNSPGTIAEKANFSLEAGRQWDVFSLGADIGKTSMGRTTGKDTTVYMEVRPNLNIFQQGRFTNTITPGIGFIINAKESFMTEVTSGIEYTFNPLIHINIYFGQYYYSGKESSSSVTFFGVSIMKYFTPYHPRGLLNNNKPKE